jgi:8-oxo-dGTP diphosphatase
MGGLWEFPGGKVEAGEAPEDALRRELAEEIGTEAEIGDRMTFAVHSEPGMRILLLFYSVSIGTARPAALEGQEIAWVAQRELRSYPMPPADAELVRRLINEATG